MSVRYVAVRLNGDGTETIIDPEAPLSGVTVTRRLNAATEISAEVSPDYPHLYDDEGRPLLQKWSTALFVEEDGDIRGGGIYVDDSDQEDGLDIDVMGYVGYLSEMPYVDSWVRTNIDPLDVFRHIWSHVQSKKNGNLGVVVDPLKSPVRTGKMVAQGQFDTENGPLSFEYEPVRLAWYETQDLAEEVTKLSEGTPFDYVEQHKWNADQSAIEHSIKIGYPRLGRRRDDIRFVIGENVQYPTISGEGDDYASEILGLGAGEGSAMKRASVVRSAETRLRRVKIIDDKSARTSQAINLSAQAELKSHIGLEQVTSLKTFTDPEELVSLDLGDEVRLLGDLGAHEIDMWVKITGISWQPEGDGTRDFEVIRADRLA